MRFIFIFFCLLRFGFTFAQGTDNLSSKSKTTTQILNTPSCDELIYYRDNVLWKDFEAAYNKYLLNLNAKLDIEKIKAELLNDKASWYQILSTNAASSEWASAYAQVANIFKLLLDKYLAILKLASGSSLLNTGLEYGTINQAYWFKVLTTSKNLYKAVSENAEREAYRAVFSQRELTKNLNTAVQAGIDFTLNINSMTQLKEDHTNLKSEIQRILGIIETQYRKYENNIKSSRDNQDNIREIVVGIDKYWEENCKNKPVSKKAAKQKKDVQHPPLTKKTDVQKEKKSAGNGFYIFLTTSLEIKPKASQFSNLQSSRTVYVMSKPLLHSGQLSDDMETEKSLFIESLEKHFINHPDVIKQIQNKEMTIHYGKPYSTEVLKTSAECNNAIEAYKQSLRDAIDGLGADPIEFLQID